MDGVSNGKPYQIGMIWVENPLCFGNISIYLGKKKIPLYHPTSGTWILPNALKAFFFLRFVQAGEVRSRTSEALTAMCWGAKLGVNPTDRILADGTFDENRGDAGGPRQVALGHRFSQSKIPVDDGCTFR